MGEGAVKALDIGESLNRRHLDVVEFLRVVGLAAPVADIGAGAGEKRLRVRDAFDSGELRFRLHVVLLGQALDLIAIEHGVALQEVDIAFDIFPGIVLLGLRDGIRVNDQ
jgi:hypothetical protein